MGDDLGGEIDRVTTKIKKDEPLACPVERGVMPTACNWFYPDPDFEMGTYFETSCNNAFQFNDGTPESNEFKYCPYCGGEIKTA